MNNLLFIIYDNKKFIKESNRNLFFIYNFHKNVKKNLTLFKFNEKTLEIDIFKASKYDCLFITSENKDDYPEYFI